MSSGSPNRGCIGPKRGLASAAMTESIYEFVLGELDKAKGRWPDIAQDIGMSLSTLRKIAKREVENPGVVHIEKLASYFREKAAA